jgi:hypothetical protein
MTQNERREGSAVSRRRVLSAVGTGALLVGGSGLALAGRRRPEYSYYTYARTDSDHDVRIAWYETYDRGNGAERVERSGGGLEAGNETAWGRTAAAGEFVDAEGRAVVTVGDVMPGDSGALVVGLSAETEPAAVSVALDVTDSAENGRNEPERAAGDTTDGDGELDGAIEATLWYDTGLAGFGACDGERLPVEGLIVADSLDGASEELAGGVPLATDGSGTPVGCIEPESATCVGFSWTLPSGTPNAVQTDSVDFSLSFAATACTEGGA